MLLFNFMFKQSVSLNVAINVFKVTWSSCGRGSTSSVENGLIFLSLHAPFYLKYTMIIRLSWRNCTVPKPVATVFSCSSPFTSHHVYLLNNFSCMFLNLVIIIIIILFFDILASVGHLSFPYRRTLHWESNMHLFMSKFLFLHKHAN